MGWGSKGINKSLFSQRKNIQKVKSLKEDNLIVNLDFSLTRYVHLFKEIKQVDDDTYMKAMEKFRDQD